MSSFLTKVTELTGGQDGKSERQKLRDLIPDFSEFLIWEFKLSYPHCILISQRENLLRAFAVALKEHDQLPSNKAYKSTLEKHMQASKLFGGLALNQRIMGFTSKTIHMMVEDLKIIFHQDRDGSFSSNIIPSPLEKLLRLSKIFSICICLIYEVSPEKYIKTLINPEMERFTSALHFLARKVENNYHLTVLISNRHAIEDNFDDKTLKTTYVEMLIRPEPFENHEFVNEVGETQSNKFIQYLIENSAIHDICLNRISTCNGTNSAVTVNREEFKENLGKARSLRENYTLDTFETSYDMATPSVLSDNFSLTHVCVQCRMSSPTLQLICGCKYHPNCLEKRFNDWDRNKQCGNKQLSELFFSCRCQAPIKLEYFFLLDVGKPFKANFLFNNMQVFHCRICQEEYGFNESFGNHGPNCSQFICSYCVLRYYLSGNQYACECGAIISINNDDLVHCKLCQIDTYACNFMGLSTFEDTIACKSCWFLFAQGEIVLNGNKSLAIEYFQSNCTFCVVCNQNCYRPYVNRHCENKCELCQVHIGENQCQSCGGSFIDEYCIW